MSNQGMSGPDMGGIEQQAQGDMEKQVDELASKVPGGQNVAEQAQNAASGDLSKVEQEAKDQSGNLPGGVGDKLGEMLDS